VDFVEPSQRSKATITPRVRPDRFCCEAAIHDSDTEVRVVGQLPITAAHKLDRVALRRAARGEQRLATG
jgi:long-chain acyl-CoA synthetase